MATVDPQELVPLESGQFQPKVIRHGARNSHLASRSCYRMPLKLCRLMVLLIVLPTACIFVPLYMKYQVFPGQMYPISMTDMRLIDKKISPTWCQRQMLRSNATFNAFVVPGAPALTDDLVPVSMTRELELEDDMKEYWGFYLLKGSTVTVSTCVRWPGASLIMIKSYKHLQACAYIGDDSSEELDEIIEAYEKGLMTNKTLLEQIEKMKKQNGKANDPGTMRRHKQGVEFHNPQKVGNFTSNDSVPLGDITDHDAKELRTILERLHALRQAAKDEQAKYYRPPDHLMSLPALHRHRDTNVDKDERKWISFKDIDGNVSEVTNEPKKEKTTTDHPMTTQNPVKEIIKIIPRVIEVDSHKSKEELHKSVEAANPNSIVIEEKQNEIKTTQVTKIEEDKKELNVETTEANSIEVSSTVTEEGLRVHTLKEVDTPYRTSAPGTEPTSKEVFEDVLNRLQGLGERGKRVLQRLHQTMEIDHHNKDEPEKSKKLSALTGSEEELDRLRKVLVEAIDEEKNKGQRQQARRDARTEARAKRELMLGQIELQKQFNEDDEARNFAAEEDLTPDGFAEHHVHLNESTPFDMSNSEFWSSFSSSEEALLECEGLILNLPLTPHSSCHREATDKDTFGAAKANALTYRVPSNGYYFFVFNSENEVQRNYIRARFDLQKTRYDVARVKLRECVNSTERCNLTLDIFSSQKVVLEVPLRNNDSLWNEHFVIFSECEPRTSVYLACAIAVPILILMFAFQ